MLCTSLSVVEKGLNEVAAGICCLEGIKELFSLMFMVGPGGLKFSADNLSFSRELCCICGVQMAKAECSSVRRGDRILPLYGGFGCQHWTIL